MKKLKYYNFIILILAIVGVIFISGCIASPSRSQTGVLPTSGDLVTPKAPEEKERTTIISPARDLTGGWEGLPGSAKWHDNVANPACSYEGFLRLALQQNGNVLAGAFVTTITKVIPSAWNTGEVPCSSLGAYPSAPLAGAVSSSSFKFKVSTIDFMWAFTEDTMQGTFESCPEQICSDGSRATGSIGEFKLARKR